MARGEGGDALHYSIDWGGRERSRVRLLATLLHRFGRAEMPQPRPWRGGVGSRWGAGRARRMVVEVLIVLVEVFALRPINLSDEQQAGRSSDEPLSHHR